MDTTGQIDIRIRLCDACLAKLEALWLEAGIVPPGPLPKELLCDRCAKKLHP